MDKYVGESEANIRKLFEAAEEEQKKIFNSRVNSGLHIIIFDGIDAICKQRRSVVGASGVHDTGVNQLLSKIDGVDRLNSILVIGMTNRPELVNDALLRPARFEVKKEIRLPEKRAGLVGAAQSCAFVRHTRGGSEVEVEYDTIDHIQNRKILVVATSSFDQLILANRISKPEYILEALEHSLLRNDLSHTAQGGWRTEARQLASVAIS